MNKEPILAIIVPCYNEEESLIQAANLLTEKLENLILEKKIRKDSYVCFIDDGSKDNTWKLIEDAKTKNSKIKGIKLIGNVGHQNALLAGLLNNKDTGEVFISIDCDLQDDIGVMSSMIDKYFEGFEIVYGVRTKRNADTLFKKYTALLFYKFMIFLGVNIVYNHADYRLITRRVVASLENFQEVNLFLRGIFPSMGYKSTNVYYERTERKLGISKYPLKKMATFALHGITSFSVKPLRIVTLIGLVVFTISLALGIYTIYSKLFLSVVPGWASIVLPIYILGGIQVLCIGILGEYIGNIYQEVKGRPKFIVDRII